MRRYYTHSKVLFVFLLLVAAGLYTELRSQWEEVNYTCSQRGGVATCATGNTIFTIGGWLEFGVPTTNVEAYNIDSQECSPRKSLSTALQVLSADTINGNIYITGGFHADGETTSNILWMYDPDIDSLTIKNEIPSGVGHHVTGVIDGKLYVAGGLHKDGPDIWKTSLSFVYDPASNEWDTVASMNSTLTVDARESGRCQASSCVYDGKLYVFGGFRFMANEEHSYLPTPEMYDPVSDSWINLPEMPAPLAHHACIVHNNKIYLFGGSTASNYPTYIVEADSIYEFDPVNETWRTLEVTLPNVMAGIAAYKFNNKLYLVGDDTIYLCKADLNLITSPSSTESKAQYLFTLYPNHPNPFSGQTMIRFDLKQQSYVELVVYDILGRKVATLARESRLPGTHSILWNTDGIDPGIYLCELRMDGFRQIIRMVKN